MTRLEQEVTVVKTAAESDKSAMQTEIKVKTAALSGYLGFIDEFQLFNNFDYLLI